MNEIVSYVKRLVLTHDVDKFFIMSVTYIMIFVHFALGLAVLLGGVEHFEYPSFQPLVDMVNGYTHFWGYWSILSACLMIYPNRISQIIGYWSGMVWQIMWCAAFSYALMKYPNAVTTTAVAFGGFAALDAVLLVARILRHERR